MHFAYPLSWWLAALLAAAAAMVAVLVYRRPIVPVPRGRRVLLGSLRALALFLLALLLFRPFILAPPQGAREAVVPVIVDDSRSMGIADADGGSRLDEARSLLTGRLLPALQGRFKVDTYGAGDQLVAAPGVADLRADARHSDLTGAIEAARERYRGQRVAALIVVSDGGDTGTGGDDDADGSGPPVFTIGVGSVAGPPDREVLGVVAGEQRLDQASVDLHASVVSRGYGRRSFPVRLLANGQTLESRTVTPDADGAPIDQVFTVSPNPLTPTVYTVEVPAEAGEAVPENNTQSVLVNPAGRKRRVLVLEGAPGFDHSFLTRALGHDPGLDLDSVTRKGQTDAGQATYLVQAAADRSATLLGGFPATREGLFNYDAVVLANVEGDFLSRDQLAQLADFVSVRGGGLLVLGARSFSPQGLSGTPLEPALPVALSDRTIGLVMPGFTERGPADKVLLTPEGERHPIMRFGATLDDTRRLWSQMPALAATTPLGAPRPGATVLAVTTADGGELLPAVAVERYGQGRSMVFAGEGSWRWRMLLPATDRRYETFWRQAVRWLAGPAPDPVSLAVPASAEPGDAVTIDVVARTRAFAPVAGASVDGTLTKPGGDTAPLTIRRAGEGHGEFSGVVRPDQPGLYRVQVEARRGTDRIGSADRWFYVGGSDREFADPRLNEALLARMARDSGGQYVRAADAATIVPALERIAPTPEAPERRDLWHEPWAFGFIVLLLSAEWVLRRRWGLR